VTVRWLRALARVQGVGLRPLVGLVMEPLDVGLELRFVHSPHTAAPDLDGRELAGANEGVDLGHADAEIGRNVFQGQETRLDGAPSTTTGPLAVCRVHLAKLAPPDEGGLDLTLFAAV
jgi:hypothetical protein